MLVPVALASALVLGQSVPSGFGMAEAAGPRGGSLMEQRQKRDQERRLADEAAFTSKECGTRIATSIAWSSFENRGGSLNVVKYCDVALSALERICRENKSKVQGNIRHVRCGAGKKRQVKISNGTLQYAVGRRPARDDHDFVYKALKDKL